MFLDYDRLKIDTPINDYVIEYRWQNINKIKLN